MESATSFQAQAVGENALPVSSPTYLPDDYLPLLDELNRIAMGSGAPLEGNLFYFHHEPTPGRHNVYDYFEIKRRNFALACQESTRMLEIGLNGGHSALLALASGVEFHGVDICYHPYTEPAAAFLKSKFANRFHFYKGDSLVVVPELAKRHSRLKFDMIHIDGHHGVDYCHQDTMNAMELSAKEAWLLLDDTDLPDIAAYYNSLVQTGSLQPIAPAGWIPVHYHSIGRLNWL